MRAADTSPAAIAEAAFLSAYPLLAGRRRMAHDTAVSTPDPVGLRAPVNTLVHGRATPDTLRCSGWLDLADGPLVLSVPDTCGRYYALWLRDAWGEVFATLGARTTGTGRRAFALMGPGHHGLRLPPGLTPIAASTRVVRISGRIEAVGQSDADGHDDFVLAPLTGSVPERAAAPLLHVGEIEHMSAADLFAVVDRLVVDDPPDRSRREALERLRGLEASAVVDRGLQDGWAALRAAGRRGPDHDGWVREADDPTADAVHVTAVTDSEGSPLSGERRYVLRFEPDDSPPVHGFWELTSGGRSIGDRHPLALDADGALTVHIQHAAPARSLLWNWLPAPVRDFTVALHLYWPRATTWSPPPITRL